MANGELLMINEEKWDCYARYLAAKKTVDDRALNNYVFEQLVKHLPERPLTILEAGCGIGTMVERMFDWRAFDQHIENVQKIVYTAVDQEATNIQALNHRLSKRVLPESFTIEPVAADIYSFIAQCQQEQKQFDLLIANAFLDLFDPADIIPKLFTLLKPNGLFYFTINFDGVTSFEPTVDYELDALIEKCYHQTMDERVINGRPSGDSRSGRHILTQLPDWGGEILAAGSSDWVVHKHENGYPHDENYFLHFIVNTVESALEKHPIVGSNRVQEWASIRHDQIDNQLLIYITHQLDVVGYIAYSSTN